MATAGENDVAGKHTQLPFLTATAFDDVPGTDRKAGWKGTQLTM
jgi:hypothetical protein